MYSKESILYLYKQPLRKISCHQLYRFRKLVSNQLRDLTRFGGPLSLRRLARPTGPSPTQSKNHAGDYISQDPVLTNASQIDITQSRKIPNWHHSITQIPHKMDDWQSHYLKEERWNQFKLGIRSNRLSCASCQVKIVFSHFAFKSSILRNVVDSDWSIEIECAVAWRLVLPNSEVPYILIPYCEEWNYSLLRNVVLFLRQVWLDSFMLTC